MCDRCDWEYYADELHEAASQEAAGSIRRQLLIIRGRVLMNEHITEPDIDSALRLSPVINQRRRKKQADPLELPSAIPSARFANLDFSGAPAPAAPPFQPVAVTAAVTAGQIRASASAPMTVKGYILSQPSYADLDNHYQWIEINFLQAQRLAAPHGLGVTLCTRDFDRTLMTTARGRDKNERYANIRFRLSQEYVMIHLIECCETGALGRGATERAQQFLNCGKPVAVLRNGAWAVVKRLDPSGVDDWKQNYARAVT